MRAGFSTHHHQQRRWWPYLYLCLAAMAVLYAISAGSFYSFTIPASAREEEGPKCPHPSSKLPKGERYMLYAPHSGFSNQVGELKNALLVSALLDRTLVLPPVFDHHAVALGSCPKFRVNDASEMRSMAWNHISELIRDGRYVAIADIIDLSKVRPFFKTIDLRIFSSLWCGVDILSACSGPVCRRMVAYGSSLGTLESCGSLLSKPGKSHGGCVYPVDDDCRTTVWVHGIDISNKSQQSGTLQWTNSAFSNNESLNGKKKKKKYQRVFKNIVDALGDGSEASKYPVLSFGSLFSSEYKGTQLHLDIQSSQDPKIRTLVEATTFLPFTPPIVNTGKWYSKEKIRRPFFCAQLRLLDGQFKNHWSKTFSSLQSQLKLVQEQRGSSEVLPLFVMTDLPRSNWTKTYLGELDTQRSAYEVHVLEEGNALIQKAAKELARHDYGIRSGFFPDDESTILEDQKHSIVRASAPDILLYIEEVICSCAALGFSGTSGSTLSENILLLREANTCNG